MDVPPPEPTPQVASVPPGMRRRSGDRREAPTPRFSRYTVLGGRREGPRRPEELEGSYVDVYRTPLLLAVLWIAIMNVGDSFFTMLHLQSGGIELNPVADGLLQTGRFGFVFMKSLAIGVALIVLTLHKNFSLARLGLWISAGAYTLLVGYHIFLLGI